MACSSVETQRILVLACSLVLAQGCGGPGEREAVEQLLEFDFDAGAVHFSYLEPRLYPGPWVTPGPGDSSVVDPYIMMSMGRETASDPIPGSFADRLGTVWTLKPNSAQLQISARLEAMDLWPAAATAIESLPDFRLCVIAEFLGTYLSDERAPRQAPEMTERLATWSRCTGFSDQPESGEGGTVQDLGSSTVLSGPALRLRASDLTLTRDACTASFGACPFSEKASAAFRMDYSVVTF